MKRYWGTVACAALVLWATLGAEANWPRFRGSNGDGVAAGAKLPTKISDKNVLWKVAAPGVGNGSPVIWGDRIFLQAATPSGSQRLFACYALSDGKKLWQQSLPGHAARMHAKNTLASGTPAADGSHVVFASWDGRDYWLITYTPEGKELWKRNLGPYASQHGAGHSPILHDGLAYFVNDNDQAATVFAVDARSGEIVWQRNRPVFPASYATPLIMANGGATSLLVASTAGMAAYDPKSGEELWNWRWPHPEKPLRMVASPLAVYDLVIAGCGDGGGARHAVALRTNGSEPTLAWELRRGIPYVPGMVPLEERIFYVTDQGIAGSLETKSGKTLWSQRLGGNGNVSASPVLAGGHIYQCNEEGELFVFKAADSFQLVSRFTLDGGVFASPAVADDRLIVRTRRSVYCLGKAN
jgi:outer membrane protein assembly factor BamB